MGHSLQIMLSPYSQGILSEIGGILTDVSSANLIQDHDKSLGVQKAISNQCWFFRHGKVYILHYLDIYLCVYLFHLYGSPSCITVTLAGLKTQINTAN